MGWALQFVVGGAQMLTGAEKKEKANNDAKVAMSMRKAYKTPEEIYKVLQATEYNSQGGLDPATLGYLTNQSDRSFSSSLTKSQALGNDANDIKSMFSQKLQSIFQIGEANHAENMKKFSSYLTAFDTLASSKDAEWMDWENKVKDRQQQAALAKLEATKQMNEGLKTITSSVSNMGTSSMYGGG